MSNTQQSPINLSDPIYADLGDRKLEISWLSGENAVNGHVVPSDHGLKVTFSPDYRQYITLDRKRFHLISFHFHHPSEHWVDGQQHTVELHVVHQDRTDGSLAVVGIFIEASEDDGSDPKMLSDLKKVLLGLIEHRHKANISTTPADFLPPKPDEYYRYEGSLTTPEYTENVKWVVMRKPLLMKPESLKSLISYLGGDARFPQPLHRRFVLASFRLDESSSNQTIALKGGRGRR